MARYTGPKNRIARRFGINIFGRKRNPLIHKPNPPGVHGAMRKKKSDYGLQLDEQQKLKAAFGMISRKMLLRYYKESMTEKGNTAHLLLEKLECRLDNIVYRLKFAQTIFHAQQLVAHGHVLVNGKRVNVRSFQVKPGMEISIRTKSHNNKLIQEALANKARELPEYLELDEKAFKGKLIVKPEHDQIQLALPVNVPLVCEFLAHTT
ncbi:MAG: 30S ribosomal protein S4 [Simkaniaceae bacterium]|nr:30S ribosomal protein S4 [Simkaniaceae bacterium]